jgi:hypothetical protein
MTAARRTGSNSSAPNAARTMSGTILGEGFQRNAPADAPEAEI